MYTSAEEGPATPGARVVIVSEIARKKQVKMKQNLNPEIEIRLMSTPRVRGCRGYAA